MILINNTLNQSENDVENSEDDEPELKPEAQKIIPYEIEMVRLLRIKLNDFIRMF